jgi:hypothetical protein
MGLSLVFAVPTYVQQLYQKKMMMTTTVPEKNDDEKIVGSLQVIADHG